MTLQKNSEPDALERKRTRAIRVTAQRWCGWSEGNGTQVGEMGPG